MRKKLLILALLLITGLLPASSYTIKLKNKGDFRTVVCVFPLQH